MLFSLAFLLSHWPQVVMGAAYLWSLIKTAMTLEVKAKTYSDRDRTINVFVTFLVIVVVSFILHCGGFW